MDCRTARTLIFILMCCVFKLTIAVTDYDVKFNQSVYTRDNLRIEILKFIAWRDWQPIVSRPGPDFGSPLRLIAEVQLTNSSSSPKSTHWEAFLKQDESGQIIPVELWDSNSEQPWGGKIEANGKQTVRLFTRSGPYLKAGSNITLYILFIADGETFYLRSEEVLIEATH